MWGHIWEFQGTICGNRLSPPWWVMGIELRWSGLEAGICTHWTILRASDRPIFLIGCLILVIFLFFASSDCMTDHRRLYFRQGMCWRNKFFYFYFWLLLGRWCQLQLRLVLNSWFSHLSFLSAKITNKTTVPGFKQSIGCSYIHLIFCTTQGCPARWRMQLVGCWTLPRVYFSHSSERIHW